MNVRRESEVVIEELEKVLALNDLLISLSKHAEAAQFAPGVGPVSLLGNSLCEILFICILLLLFVCTSYRASLFGHRWRI